MNGLIIDNFSGGGGASAGIELAGYHVDAAINHDADAIEMHAANHPETLHLIEDVFKVKPRELCAKLWRDRGRCGTPEVDLLWLSPDCRHHSKAKGGKPNRSRKIRGLAWVAVKWAEQIKNLNVIILENVEEFQDWGPLDENGRPVKARKGQYFRMFVTRLRNLGFNVEWRELVAADYGAPTIRKRLFLIARRDRQPIVWPEPTHSKDPSAGDLFAGESLRPWRTAAECIDWSLPCPSIFERSRPLKENTMRRIALGLKRYVLDAAEPYIVVCNHESERFRGQGLTEPLRTITAARDATGLVMPSLIPIDNKSSGPVAHGADEPLRTITTENRFALVAPFLAKHYGGVVGHGVSRPIGTVTAVDHHSLVAAFLTKFYGTNIGADLRQPMPTVTATGQHIAEVRAFLIKYYGCGVGQSCREPMHTVTTKDRMGLVTVAGVDYQIADIGLRMLQPHELAAAQGFPADYVLTGTKSNQVAKIGNSVCPPVVAALVRANLSNRVREEEAA